MKRIAIPAAALVVLAGFLFWWFSPVQVLKRRTLSLLETLTMDAGTGKSTRQLGVYSLNALLAPEVELRTPTIDRANGTFERSELESAFSWLCQQAKQTRFDLKEFRSVDISGDRGKVVFSLEALVELPAYRPADGRFGVTFHWQREEESWHLTGAEWLEEKR